MVTDFSQCEMVSCYFVPRCDRSRKDLQRFGSDRSDNFGRSLLFQKQRKWILRKFLRHRCFVGIVSSQSF